MIASPKMLLIIAAAVLSSSLFTYSPYSWATEKGSYKPYVVAGKWKVPKSVTAKDQSGGAEINIIAPADGATLPAGEPVIMTYDIKVGEKGNHFHYYLDGEQVGSIRILVGKLDYGKLAPGKHVMTLKIANVAHILIGVEMSITVTVK